MNTPITSFRTHTGDIVTGAVLTDALKAVGDDWERMERAIRKQDTYAAHVSEERKDANLERGLISAQRIRDGHVTSFTIAQRLNTKLTGECIALLPKG